MRIFVYMKNVVFDLGRVVFAQDPKKSSDEFRQFFSYVQQSSMPQFWVDYDLGVSTLDDVVRELSAYRGVEEEYTRELIMLAISRQACWFSHQNPQRIFLPHHL